MHRPEPCGPIDRLSKARDAGSDTDKASEREEEFSDGREQEVNEALTLSRSQLLWPLPLEIGREHIPAEETQIRVEILQHRPEDRNVDAVLGCTAREFPGCTDVARQSG